MVISQVSNKVGPGADRYKWCVLGGPIYMAENEWATGVKYPYRGYNLIYNW